MEDGMAMMIYLSPNPAFFEEYKYPEYHKIPKEGLKLYQKLRNISDAPNDSLKWEIWNLNSTKDLNFTIFFQELLKNYSTSNLTNFKFAVKNPEYIQKLEKVLIETSPLEMQALFLSALKEKVKNYGCENVFEDFMPHIANLLYISLNNDTTIKSAKDKLITDFQKLIETMKIIIQPYLQTLAQKELVEEKLKNVELTTEAPNWLYLDDFIDRLKNEYLQLPTNATILELLKFVFQQKLSKFEEAHEALRSFEHDEIPMSRNEIFYSEIGNWLTIPISVFMQYNYDNRNRVVLELGKNIAKIVSYDSFRWSSMETTRNFGDEIFPLDLKEQNFCYNIHGILKEDYSVSLGLEAAWMILTHGLSGIEKRDVTKNLARIVLETNTTVTFFCKILEII
uniref:Uncharacterized protein n=1 Tax=Panagrolaimus davidi TaxID=227884 RepID=A0A914R0A7_9BILA